MEKSKLFLMECHVAGCEYHDALEVWEELKVGTPLRLVRDADNSYDPQAVALVFKGGEQPSEKKENLNRDEEDGEEYILGYIPREQNNIISILLDMGWDNILECRISRLDPTVHYENMIHVIIRVKKNKKTDFKMK